MHQTSFLPPTEAASIIGIHRNTLDAHIKAGQVEVRRLGARIGIARTEVERIQREGLPPVKWPSKSRFAPKPTAAKTIDVPINNGSAAPSTERNRPVEDSAITLAAAATASAPQSPARALWRGIDLESPAAADWCSATGMTFLPPTVRARLRYVAGTDPQKPKLPKPATPEELEALGPAFEAHGVPVPPPGLM